LKGGRVKKILSPIAKAVLSSFTNEATKHDGTTVTDFLKGGHNGFKHLASFNVVSRDALQELWDAGYLVTDLQGWYSLNQKRETDINRF
jgi:hypothetical protein